ncbi:MAG: ammonium transporter, partial [Desulfocapsaceae bacterium]|nr:ammonium transporter [Desulfocapsaceae bacterium]
MKPSTKMKPRTYWGGALFLAILAVALPALAEETGVADTVIHLAYSIDTFYFLMSGALGMWMAAGFSMLEAGLVRSKNTVEILTKNVALYSIACIMYMIVGYNLMYGGGPNGVIPGLSFFLSPDNAVDDVLKSGGEIYYSGLSDFFFQVVFVATAMSIVSG